MRQLFRSGRAGFYAVDSISTAAAEATATASAAILIVALGALGLGAVVSLWLARVVASPIDQLSQQLRRMTTAREFSRRLPPSGSSEELDALTGTFNEMMASLVAAEDETEAAYVAAIKALAAALDARDPYTSGHSERVSALSVMVGRHMVLPDDEIEVLRLGALLHDIGKIGIRDRVLAKKGPLTDEEFEIIKTHPTVGANILAHVPFLSAHMPIVELHHEQPDGRGYPHGLFGHATPLLARIVHVADAFDAMTSARAYRPAAGRVARAGRADASPGHAVRSRRRRCVHRRLARPDDDGLAGRRGAHHGQHAHAASAHCRRRREVALMRIHRALAAFAMCAALATSPLGSAGIRAAAANGEIGADTVISADGVFERDETSGGDDIRHGGRLADCAATGSAGASSGVEGIRRRLDAGPVSAGAALHRPGHVRLRVEGGYLPSPIGILPLESRADLRTP